MGKGIPRSIFCLFSPLRHPYLGKQRVRGQIRTTDLAIHRRIFHLFATGTPTVLGWTPTGPPPYCAASADDSVGRRVRGNCEDLGQILTGNLLYRRVIHNSEFCLNHTESTVVKLLSEMVGSDCERRRAVSQLSKCCTELRLFWCGRPNSARIRIRPA